jgi:hypothetical protein
MAQMGFFDLSDRTASPDARRDPLVGIDAIVPREAFRPALDRVRRKPAAARKARAGRKPVDAVVMFKTLVPGALCTLSDDRIEYRVRDLLSVMRLLGFGPEDRVPDARTVWLYRVGLAQAGLVEALVKEFDGCLARQGCIARGGQLRDASIVPVPKNRTTRAENKAIRAGEVPEGRADKPARRSQKGEPRVAIGSRPAANDARWSEEDRKTVRWGLLKKPHASGSLCMSMVERLRCRVGKSAGNGNFSSPGRCGI